MIQGRLDGRGAVLSTTAPAGCVSYVDRDWLTAAESPIPSLSFALGGEVLWCGDQLGRIAVGTDSTAVAASALLGVAREATAAVAARVRGTVEVVGNGLVAAHVRRLVASDGGHRPSESPSAVIDMTGDPETIRSALGRVSDLGTVILAGEAGGRTLDLDLYSSVHTRGLVLAGVAPPLHGIDVADMADVDERDLAFCREALAEASSGAPVPGDALWYRIVA